MSDERLLQGINTERPFIAEIETCGEEELVVTVATYDIPSIFSLLTGILSSLEMEIRWGEIRTVSMGTNALPSLPKNMIVDRFSGTLPDRISPALFQKSLNHRLEALLAPLKDRTTPDAAASRRTVNEWIAQAVHRRKPGSDAILLPVQLKLEEQAPDYTWIEITAQDSPFFLYSVATAITLQGISVERVEISTISGKIRDRFALLDRSGRKLSDRKVLNRLRFSILFTKQFTFFLGEAPDPYAAITRFESLLEDLANSSDMERWKDLLENPETLKELAKLLGMSDFLWEEFIRLQYENILPLLGSGAFPETELDRPVSREDFEYRLQVSLSRAEGYEEKKAVLNAFKDHEIYKLDLRQILMPREDFIRFSQHLTLLAEAVAATAFSLAEDRLSKRYGSPRTVAGLPVPFAVLGLGKLGGQALGYASDIELLCVYSDNGRTDGERSISNAEYFDRLVKEAAGIISAKKEGIFHIDLRLRPHGSAGPAASSLERFSAYYRDEAHSFERLALVRLRSIAGDPELGVRVETLRDEIVYVNGSLDLAELRSLRQKQLAEKVRPGSFNAKFSTGALVDVEYTVQILQVEHGKNSATLRTASIHRALGELSRRGIIRSDEAEEITQAYRFLRRLINALRMLRGSARDLYLPQPESDEFMHLARRMGYAGREGMSPREQLQTEFEQRTARVRGFVEHYLGRESLPADGAGTIADLILFPESPRERREAILSRYGFRNPQRGAHNFESLARKAGNRELFTSVAILAVQELLRQSDPDMALNNWERFASGLQNGETWIGNMLSQPTRITLLMQLFSGSQALSDTLIGEPALFDEITAPELIHRALERAEFEKRLLEETAGADSFDGFIAGLRHAKKRELLRIGTRDICYGAPLEEITTELSLTAESQISAALDFAWKEQDGTGQVPVVIGAFGKLGGGELNYSSDLDLVGIVRTGTTDTTMNREEGRRLMDRMRALLAAPSSHGAGYRIDFRLRPFGRSGNLLLDLTALQEYYAGPAAPWEIQALLKLRLLDADPATAEEFRSRITPFLRKRRNPGVIIEAVRRNRERTIRTNREIRRGMREIKNGPGGIRDIEFLVQALQLIHAPDIPELLCGSTLKAMDLLGSADILKPMDQRSLNEAYRLLRRTEHFLQLYEDRQVHSLPGESEKLETLARRCAGIGAREFENRIDTISSQVQRIMRDYFAVEEEQP